jgi:eukaryotic-like serine/threonine-protein kinase
MLGTTLHSHYKIDSCLGIGRSGPTYLARDIDLPDCLPRVIKVIQYHDLDPVSSPLTEKLFEIQSSIAYKIGQHPQIPSLIGKFEEDDTKYLVREYVDGELLDRELVRSVAWSQSEVFDFLIDLIGILCFVHSCRYIHQEIDPHHIIRRSDDRRFNLIGLRLVKDLDSPWQNNIDDRDRSIPPSIYIPYEQEQHKSQFNSDIYAVGAIAIQFLLGKSALDRDPDTYELKWKDDVEIEPQLVKILDRMVRPDYRHRYQSAIEVLQDLQSFALAQIPMSRSNKIAPRFIFSTIICTLLVGFIGFKLLSNSTNKSPSLPSKMDIYARDKLKNYSDKIAGIKIKYLPSWSRSDIHNVVTGENVVFASPQQNKTEGYIPNLSIRIENLTNDRTSLADYTKLAIAEIDRYYQEAKVIESSSILLAKKPANLVTYIGKDEHGKQMKNLEAWTIYRGKAYILTYKAEPQQYSRSLETVMMMINSFELE